STKQRIALDDGITQKNNGRSDEPKKNGKRADEKRAGRRETRKRPRRRGHVTGYRVRDAASPARHLDEDERDSEDEEPCGDLRGGNGIAEAEPGAEDSGGERLHREIVDHTEIGNRFHQHEREPARNGGTRAGKGDTEKGAPGLCAEIARGV